MEILQADVMGFCFGVRRAIESAEQAGQEHENVTTLGPLVHNPQETARLEATGIKVVQSPAEITGDTVVIRAHGARPETLAELQRRGLNVINATCPFVTKSQRLAHDLTRNGYTLVIVGHRDHPEVQGILGYAGTTAYVVNNAADVANLPADIRPGVIAQTTVNEESFKSIVACLSARYPDLMIHDTVCSATRERQEAARELAATVEAVYVIGGRESSNTNRLAEICREVCPRTYLIETAEEITAEQVTGVTRVGVTAGASTPHWLIEQVMARLREVGEADS